MPVSSFSRILAPLATVILGGALIAACSSATDDGSGQTSEALLGKGQGPCPAYGCEGPPHPLAPTCSVTPRQLDGDAGTNYTPAAEDTDGGGCIQVNMSTELSAFGCQPEFYYQASSSDPIVPAALCPGVPANTQVLPSDSCTGEPPSGWTFVTWSDICGTIGGGCHSSSCRTF